MLELMLIGLFCWLLFKALDLALRLAWGTTKVVAYILFALAVPILLGCVIFAGGLLLLIPLAIIAGALLLVKRAI